MFHLARLDFKGNISLQGIEKKHEVDEPPKLIQRSLGSAEFLKTSSRMTRLVA